MREVNKIRRNWIYKDGRIETEISAIELCEKYPSENLNQIGLNRMARGERNCYKGWRSFV